MKVAIVTAGSRGIGAACARELAGRGYALAIMSRSSSVHAIAEELKAIGIVGSVTSTADLTTLVAQTMDKHGRIDAVVNNTGDPPKPPNHDILKVDDGTWAECHDLLLMNVIRMTRLVAPIMQAQGGGAIVNISAADAYEPDKRFGIGSTYRAALGAYTKLAADQLAPHRIRVNAVLPGVTLEEELDRPDIRAEVPLGRAATPQEIAKTVAFLLSDDASYVTGQNIRVDGGLTRGV